MSVTYTAELPLPAARAGVLVDAGAAVVATGRPLAPCVRGAPG